MSIPSVIREFKLSSLAVNNKTSILVLTFLVFFLGINAYNSMPKESFPEITQPEIYVGVMYPGTSPIDIENLITRPIEKEINTISGLEEINSTSIQGYSTIIATFNLDMDVDKALQEVKDAVDKAKPELPMLREEPNVFELDFSEFPIMNINLYGDMEIDIIEKYAEYLEDEIEKIDDISKVDIRGVLDKEVKVEVDPLKMNQMKVSFYDIEQAIQKENITISGGDLLTDGFRRNVRIVGEYRDVSKMRDIVVKSDFGRVVYLKDVASVSFGYEEPDSYARLNGQPVIMLDVKKKSGGNIINAAEKIQEILEHAEKDVFPDDLNIIITGDQSKQTRTMVDSLENNIISGVILVVLVLLFFLGLRNAAFVGIAIPMSMLMGFAVLHFSGVTLNMMVLFSLILALGMLVDNGIVVVENIYRNMSEGKENDRAAKEGVGEVALAIIASTATTLAAFLPLVFWKDLMGEFMKYLPITLIIVLSSSLFVALVINPVLTAIFMKVDKEGARKKSKRRFWVLTGFAIIISIVFYLLGNNTAGGIFFLIALIALLNRFVLIPSSRWFQANILLFLENLYIKVLRFALYRYNPILFLLGTFLLLLGSCGMLMVKSPKSSLFPDNYPQYVNVFIELPIGTDIEETNAFTKVVEQRVNQAIEPYRDVVEAVLAQVGEGTSDPNEGFNLGTSPHKARVNVTFVEFQERNGVNTSEVMKAITKSVEDLPGARITIGKDPVGPPVGKPINVEVIGPNISTLIRVSEDMRRFMEEANIPGIDGLKTDLETGKPQLIIHVDRDAAGRFGTSTRDIALQIQNALFGKEVSKYKEGEDDYPIELRFNQESRYDLQTLMNQKLTFQDQRAGSQGRIVQIPISAVADIEYSSTYGSVKRKDMDRVITIFSNVEEGYNANEIVMKLKERLKSYQLPEGYEYRFTGEQEEQAESQAFLQNAMMIAVFLIILIIVSQFNSIFTPIIIIMTVVFSTIGVFLGISIFSMDFVVLMMGIGIISLAGIVVNNAIVLIDYTNLVRKRRRVEIGLDGKDMLPYNEVINTIVEAGDTRFRPVVLTAVTTVLGLIPLALGININFFTLLSDFDPQIYIGGDSVAFWGPMAWTVIFGLTFATFLTLVIVPVMYLLFDRLMVRGKLLLNRFSE